tara:strand:- start:2970 stop:3713 length:744 start_codon:yes stop_codon:yes gene_type:complete
MAISNKINHYSNSGNRRKFNFKYVLAEIFLITAGILIALGIDNWNNNRIEQNEVDKYLIEIKKELENNIKWSTKRKIIFEKKIKENIRVLNILNENNKDSIVILKKILDHINRASSQKPNVPIFEEFLNQDFLPKINDDELRQNLKAYKIGLQMAEIYDEFDREEVRDVVKPFMLENINYGQIYYSTLKFEEGGPVTDFSNLFDNLKFYNIVNFRGARLKSQLEALNFQSIWMKKTISLLDKELKNK